MPNNKSKLPPLKSEQVAFRRMALASATFDDATRSVPVTLATREAVKVYDRNLGMIDEVFVMRGVKMPKQVPMVDTHNHESVRNIIGSVRELRLDNDEVVGRAYFGSKAAAVEAYNDAKEGHLTDISAGMLRLRQHYLVAGQSELVEGRTVRGPARIVDEWQPIEGSAVTVGADRHSTFGSVPALRAYFDPQGMQEEAMDVAYREMLTGLGMPAELTDEQAVAWGKENLAKRGAETPKVEPVVENIPDGGDHKINDDASQRAAAELAAKRAADDEFNRQQTIRRTAKLAGVGSDYAETLISNRNLSAADAAVQIEAEQSKRREVIGVRFVESSDELFRAAVSDGFTQRMFTQAGVRATIEKPAAGASEFQGLRLLDIAKRCLEKEQAGCTRHLSDREIASRALQMPTTFRSSDGPAYHTTGNFANLLLDASNKTLLASFENVPTTYQRWARNAGTVPDFKNINRTRLSEVGNLPQVEENGTYEDMSLSDSKETYQVKKHGSVISLSWETIKNDDLNAFSRLVMLQGAAAKRTINASVYQVIFDNAALSDGIALFHASSHGANLVTSDLAVSVLDTAYSAMMLQTGLNSQTILGIVPRYLIVAAGIAGTAMQLLGSIADPAAGGSSAGNANTKNVYGPGGPRMLELIVEPLLTGNDADSWLLAADYSQVDTIEYAFLEGEQTPVFEQETAFYQDAVKYKVRQTWGVAAIDYRGLYKSNGTG